MHLLHKRTEEAEIVMRGGAESGAVGGTVHVRDIRADAEMNRYGNAVFVGSNEDAAICVLDIDDAAREKLSGSFAVADANALGKFGELVDVLAGFGGHAELAFADAGFDVFGSVAGEGDFEIVDERGAVHGDSGNEAAFHEVDENRAEPDFDDVASDAPKDGFAPFARAVDRGEELAKIFGGENSGE